MNSVVNKYYNFSVAFTKILLLNTLWVLCTLLGLGIFGFMPATVAMFSVTRKWSLGEKDIPVVQTFWDTYKREFLKANSFGVLFIGVLYVLIVSYGILSTQTGAPYIISGYIIIALLLLFLIGITYFFPLYVHFDLKFMDYIKWPLTIGLSHPILTFLLLVGTTIIGYLFIRFIPGLLLFVGGAAIAYLVNKCVATIYPYYSS